MNPVKAGTPVKFEVSIDLFAPDDIIFLAMRSCDNLNQTSAISEPVKLILDTTPPDDVTDLVATLLGSNVEITFTAPGDDSDKGIGKEIIYFFLQTRRYCIIFLWLVGKVIGIKAIHVCIELAQSLPT